MKTRIKQCSTVLLLGLTSLSAAFAGTIEQCNQKMTNTLFDRAPSAQELTNADPMASVNEMLDQDEFFDFFAGFLNSKMNHTPVERQEDDVTFNIARHYVLKRNTFFEEMFIGKVDISGQNVNPRENGLGYFSVDSWRKRYAGNEQEGYKLATAYQLVNNVLGVEMEAATVSDSGDSSVNGRKAPQCSICHFEGPFALDKIALILDRKRITGDPNNISFDPAIGEPQDIIGEVGVTDVNDMVNRMVKQDRFNEHACELAFEFIYGRKHGTSETQLFNGCVSTFAAEKTIKSAMSYYLTDSLFCKLDS